MALYKRLNDLCKESYEDHKKMVYEEAMRVAKNFERLLEGAAKNGIRSRSFSEMTVHLRDKFPNANDLTTRAFLDVIGSYFDEGGLRVEGPKEIPNVNGFQMEIEVFW